MRYCPAFDISDLGYGELWVRDEYLGKEGDLLPTYTMHTRALLTMSRI